MKKFFLALVFLFSVSFTSFSQNTQPTPKPADEDDVVKISTTLIQLDVAVTDEKGNVVKDLKPEDFEIYENGKKQDVTNFSFVSAGSETTEAARKPDKTDKLAVPLPPSNIKPEQIRRTIALVVDDLTLSFESTYYVRRALKKFVDQQMQDGDLVAIIRTGGGIGALQQFTSDKRMLYAAIEKIRWNLTGTGLTGAFAPYTPDPLENTVVTLDQSAEKNEQTRAINDRTRQIQKERSEAAREFTQRSNQFRTNSFVSGTLGAISYVVRGMKDLPGRKSIMLLSDGFEIFDRSNEGIGESGLVLERLRKLIDEANRSSVVIYSLDARGVQTLGITAEDSFIGESYQDDLTNPAKQQRIVDGRREQFFNTQEGLVFLSRETGGFPILNTNDLGGGIRKVLNDQSYYLIGYQPDEATFDPTTRRFNKIEIKVKGDNLNVRYRSGFFGVSEEQIKNRRIKRRISKLLPP
jgi:VWFA-related protein